MLAFSKNEVKDQFELVNKFCKKKFPNGVSLEDIRKQEISALKLYLKAYISNVESGNTKSNSKCKKLRLEWYFLETIEKVLELNNLKQLQNLDFCINDFENQYNLFSNYVKKAQYFSYNQEDDLSRE